MDQPPPLRTLLKLGGSTVTHTSHVIVHDASADAQSAAELLAHSFSQLTHGSHTLGIVSEEVFLRARDAHSLPSNDGAPCRTPIVVGSCLALTKALTFTAPSAAAAAAAAAADWTVLSHPVEMRTFIPSSGSVETTTALALHFRAPASDALHARNTRAAVLWFAKEVLACDISLLCKASASASASASTSGSDDHSLHRVLSPLPNTQLNIDRLTIAYSFPSELRADPHLDLEKWAQELPILITGNDNAVIEMQLPHPPAAAAPSAAAAVSSSSSASYTPSPSPPVAVSSLAPHESPPVAKHSALQPLPAGTGAVRRKDKPMIAVDLDEVLGSFVEPLAQWHNAVYGTDFRVVDFHSYHFASVWGGSNDEAQEKIAAFFKSKYFQDIPVVPGARETLTALHDRFDFAVVTSRQHSIEAQTREWLGRHYPNLFVSVLFGNHYAFAGSGPIRSKPEMCRHVFAVALIDDSLTYARQCSSVVEKVCLFDRDGSYTWNRNLGEPLPINTVRCLSWDAIREQLEDWAPTGELIRLNAEPE